MYHRQDETKFRDWAIKAASNQPNGLARQDFIKKLNLVLPGGGCGQKCKSPYGKTSAQDFSGLEEGVGVFEAIFLSCGSLGWLQSHLLSTDPTEKDLQMFVLPRKLERMLKGKGKRIIYSLVTWES